MRLCVFAGRKDKLAGEKLYSVSLCGKTSDSSRSIGFIPALLFFYRSPLVKFCMNVVGAHRNFEQFMM